MNFSHGVCTNHYREESSGWEKINKRPIVSILKTALNARQIAIFYSLWKDNLIDSN